MQGSRNVVKIITKASKLKESAKHDSDNKENKKTKVNQLVTDTIKETQANHVLTPKEESTMAVVYTEEAVRRALDSDIKEMPEWDKNDFKTIEKIISDPIRHLIELYTALDNDYIKDHELIELKIAELAFKEKNELTDGSVSRWLNENEAWKEYKKIVLGERYDLLNRLIDDKITTFERNTEEEIRTSNKGLAILCSVLSSTAVCGVKMYLNDGFTKEEGLKAVATATIAGVVTAITANITRKNELGTLTSAGMGTGIGLIIGGGAAYGLDLYNEYKDETKIQLVL